MKVHLMEIGREKIDKIVEVEQIEDLYGEVGKYLMSRDIELRYNPESNEGIVLVGGFRTVGKFSVITDKVSKESLEPPTIVFKEKELCKK